MGPAGTALPRCDRRPGRITGIVPLIDRSGHCGDRHQDWNGKIVGTCVLARRSHLRPRVVAKNAGLDGP